MGQRERGLQRRNFFKIIAVALMVAGVLSASMVFDVRHALNGFLEWIQTQGAWGAVLFVLAYVLATVLFLPGFILTLGGGFVFGVAKGAILVSIGSTLGATTAFLIGRHLARDWVAAKVEGNPQFRRIDEAVAREGWRIVGLIRLSPIFPFNLLNYTFGLTKVLFRHYVVASWAGMLPGTILYVYIGSLAGDLATVGSRAERTSAEWVLYGAGLVATLLVTLTVTRIARAALREKVA
jgi:uncharacterized membrane protein YdjX (TVP38/TMEM64 family)